MAGKLVNEHTAAVHFWPAEVFRIFNILVILNRVHALVGAEWIER